MKGKGIAGLVCGIVALVLAWWGFTSLVALPLAIVGLVLSASAKKGLKAAGQPAGAATAGFVIGIIAVVLTAITFFTCGLCTICLAAAGDAATDAISSLA